MLTIMFVHAHTCLHLQRCRSGVVEILCRKSRSFWKKKDPEQVWKQCTLEISDSEMLQYYRNRKVILTIAIYIDLYIYIYIYL